MKVIGALGYKNYRSDENLLKRKVFAGYFRPRIDLVKKIVGELRLNGYERILDVGCGNGYVLIEIRKKYKHHGNLYGVDIAPGILKKAISSNIKTKSRINFSQGDARDLKFSNNYFDIVILKHVLHNIPNYHKAINECRRVLKPGGKMAIVLTGKKTRMVLKKMRPKIAKVLGINFFPDPEKYVNLENIKRWLNRKKWKTIIIPLKSRMLLKKIRPYLDYVDSGRDFWGKIDNEKWQKALEFSEKYFKSILKTKKVIRDYSTLGLVIATKIQSQASFS